MGRTVLTRKDVAALTAEAKERKTLAFAAGGTLASDATPTTPSAPEPDTYRDRLIKYIPSDVVAIYLSLIGLSKLLQDGPQPYCAVGHVCCGVDHQRALAVESCQDSPNGARL